MDTKHKKHEKNKKDTNVCNYVIKLLKNSDKEKNLKRTREQP